MFYEILALTGDSQVTNLVILQAKLRSRYQQHKSAPDLIEFISEKQLIIKWTNFQFTIYKNTESYVLEESQDIARNFPQYPKIAKCDRRLEVSSDEDRQMEHFNDYIFIQETIEHLGRVFLYEPQTGQLYRSQSYANN